MKKLLFVNLLFCIATLTLPAQYLEWVKRSGIANTEEGMSVDVSSTGSVFSTGYFRGTVDFDAGPAVVNLSSAGLDDIFILKHDKYGNLLWAKKVGGTSDYDCGYSIVTDSLSNVYVAGRFLGTADFDPGPGTATLFGSTVDDNGFILKLDSNGNFTWVKQLSQWTVCQSVSLDNNSNILVTGYFGSTADFDPGTSTHFLSPAGGVDIFVLKLDTAGNFKWAKKIGGASNDFGRQVVADNYGNVHVTGTFQNLVDFDPGPGTFSYSSYGAVATDNGYVLKLDSAGNFRWATSTGTNPAADYSSSLCLDKLGNVYSTGNFYFSPDFDPDTSTYTLTSHGNDDVYIQKLDSGGHLVWAKNFGGTGSERGRLLSIDDSANIYISGGFADTVDFDPGPGVYNLSSPLFHQSFISKLDSGGNFKWARHLAGGTNYVYGLNVNKSGDVYLTGSFNNTVDFNINSDSTNLTSNGSSDQFLLKLNQQCGVIIHFDSVAFATCNSPGFASLSATDGLAPYSFSWNTIPAVSDSFILATEKGLYLVTVQDANGCSVQSGVLIYGPDSSGYDLQIYMVSNPFVVGFPTQFTLDAFNDGCDTISGTMSVVLDSNVTYNNANPPPFQISGDTLTWNFSSITADSMNFKPEVFITTNSQIQAGQSLCFDVKIAPKISDSDTSNNYKTYCYIAVASHDPNMISVHPGVCPENYVLSNEKLTYTIQFQNTGSSAAVNVQIRDSVSSSLDLNSAMIIAYSHPMIPEVLAGNVLNFRFDNIMLPDSGTNEPASHGYVIYEIDQIPNLANGTQIKNQADIYFDFNPPVITNEVLNTVIDVIPACQLTTSVASMKNESGIKVYPNPAKDVVMVEGVSAGDVIQLMDLSGRVCVSQTAKNTKEIISIEQLSRGAYVFRITTQNKAANAFKFIKQ